MNSRVRRILLLSFVGTALLALVPAGAAASGSISGNVTIGSQGSGQSACVRAYDSTGWPAKDAVTDSNGDYTLDGLDAGSYRVGFTSCDEYDDVIGEYYPDVKNLDNATPVTVSESADTPGVDANLVLGGSISGKVDVANWPMGSYGTCVLKVMAWGASGLVGEVDYSFVGEYKLIKLPPGDYKLEFFVSCPGLMGTPTWTVTEYFNDKNSRSEATPVTVTEGSSMKGANVLMGDDGTISGSITDGNGAPLDDVCVEAFDSNGDPAGVVAHTAGGNYVVTALKTGSYRVKFSDCVDPADPFVATEFYDDVATIEEATPVAVSTGVNTSGIDAQLAVAPTQLKAAIGKVTIVGPARATKGRKTIQKVRITNSGTEKAKGVVLRVTGRGIGFGASVGSIPAGATRTIKARLKPKRAGRTKLSFKVSSSIAGRKTVQRVIAVGR